MHAACIILNAVWYSHFVFPSSVFRAFGPQNSSKNPPKIQRWSRPWLETPWKSQTFPQDLARYFKASVYDAGCCLDGTNRKAGRVAILWFVREVLVWKGEGKIFCYTSIRENCGLCQIMEGYHINDVLDICIQAFRKGLKPGWYSNVFQVWSFDDKMRLKDYKTNLNSST